jgi:hypothetical protein
VFALEKGIENYANASRLTKLPKISEVHCKESASRRWERKGRSVMKGEVNLCGIGCNDSDPDPEMLAKLNFMRHL